MSIEAKPKKISALPQVNSLSSTDLLVIVRNAGTSNAITEAITVNNALIIAIQGTPANSTINCSSGAIMYDNNYIYVAVANNTLKRAALQTF